MTPQQLRQHIQRIKRERAVTVTAPSGLEYKIVRASMTAYLEGGRLPENFVVLMRRAASKQISVEQAIAQLTPEDSLAYDRFLAQMLLDCVLEPKIVPHATSAEDEIDIGELTQIGDYEFLAMQVVGLVPDQPVQTKEGETSVAALEQFRDESGRAVSADAGSNSAEVQPTPV